MATNNSIFTDNLTYHPIQEWTGDIIQFGMPTFDGNYRLTEIITSSQGAQEATMRAIELAKSNSQYAYASSAPVLFIVRELFGNSNFDITTMAPVQAGESFIESEFEVAAELAGKNWMLDYTIPADLGHLEAFNQPLTKFIEGPRVFTATEGTLATGNYQTDGMPWIRIEWESVDATRCQDPSITDLNKCDNAIIIPDYCSSATGGEIVASRELDGTQIVFATSKNNCENRQLGCWRSTNGSSWHKATWWETEEECVGKDVTNQNYWFHWNEEGNVWGGEKTGATWPTAYTANSFVEYNLKESEDRTKWPETWTSTTAVNQTIHFSEIGNNGLMQDGRATRIWRVANDHIFDIRSVPANCATPIVQDGWCEEDLSIRDESECVDVNGYTWRTTDYVIGDQSTCETFGFTWNPPTTIYGDVEEMPIDENAFIIQGMPAHAWANNSNAVVNDRTASTSGSNLTVYWRAPQRTTTTYARAYPPPDRYRVYRTRYYKNGQTNDSDWVNNIKVFVGEVEHTDDYNNHSITETSQKLMGLGVRRYEYVYYFITSVWDDWNQMSSGLTIDHRTGYDNYKAAWSEEVWVWDFFPVGHYETVNHPEEGDRIVDTVDMNQIYGENGYGPWTNYSYSEYNKWAIGLSNSVSNVARRAYGYFRARVTGYHTFWLNSDDDGWLWLGNAGETVGNLIARRTNGNATCALPGDHGNQQRSGSVYMTAGQFYPILSYNANHGGPSVWYVQFQEPGGHVTFNGMYHYYNSQSLPPTGQEVEGMFSSHVGGRFT